MPQRKSHHSAVRQGAASTQSPYPRCVRPCFPVLPMLVHCPGFTTAHLPACARAILRRRRRRGSPTCPTEMAVQRVEDRISSLEEKTVSPLMPKATTASLMLWSRFLQCSHSSGTARKQPFFSCPSLRREPGFETCHKSRSTLAHNSNRSRGPSPNPEIYGSVVFSNIAANNASHA